MRYYYKQVYANKMDNIEEMYRFLENIALNNLARMKKQI